ncbi:MAG: type II toxin-antitoxin system HipA family toxin [Sulfuriferula sp.]|nr:type II toxin-antitoxin system HipA family toxin [Sulfuriferula sp.]
MKSIVEIYVDGIWHEAALIESSGRDCCTFEYLPEYVFGNICQPVSLTLPVSLETRQPMGVCPPFLLDMVPQGNGRRYLIQRLGLTDSDNLVMPLIQRGAFNPIGRLRLDTAVEYANSAKEDDAALQRGFTLDEIVGRKDDFIENLSQHGMLGAGTTGLQGASAKFMLVKNHEDLWFIDAFAQASDIAAHWLLKLPRGKHETDLAILKNEAAYIKVARACGLRSHGETFHRDGMLFVPRFDRVIEHGMVTRLHQESLASLAGHRSFDIRPNHYDLVNAFLPVVSDPVTEVIEYIKRDLLNLAIRNTDNHARNTAIQQLANGTVQLTPIFDIAPMFMDRDMIVRASRWLDKNGKIIHNFADVIEALPLKHEEKNTVMLSVKSFSNVIENLPLTMEACGVDADIIAHCKQSINAVYESIEKGHSIEQNGRSR